MDDRRGMRGHGGVLAAIALGLLLVACSPRVEPEPKPVATSERPASEETSWGARFAPDDPGIQHEDIDGRRPEDVVATFVEAVNARDWATVYAQYADTHMTYDQYFAYRDDDEWEYLEFAVREVRVTNELDAQVRVTYTVRYGPRMAPPSEYTMEEPGIWWPVFRHEGRWYLSWGTPSVP